MKNKCFSTRDRANRGWNSEVKTVTSAPKKKQTRNSSLSFLIVGDEGFEPPTPSV